MTMHRLTAGAGYRYLVRHVASGDCARRGATTLADYYVESGNPPGTWLGRGLVGLAAPGVEKGDTLTVGSVVRETAMARLFSDGTDPVTGSPLGRRYPKTSPARERVDAQIRALPGEMGAAARQSAIDAITRVELGREVQAPVAGFDLTFTVVKSVSTLWVVADTHARQAIYDAHHAAVQSAMATLEDRALFTRTGARGCRQEATRGAVAAAFVHWDSRAGDPNLHTHVVLANKVQGLDGAWRSLDSRALHHAVVAISELYEALLVDEITRRLPVRWTWRGRGPRRSPAFELDGVPDELMAHFSQRATQIDEAMTDVVAKFASSHGRGPNRLEIVRLRQQVTRATRPAKLVRPLAELLDRWRRRATEMTGQSPAALAARVIRSSWLRPVRLADLERGSIEHLAALVLDGVRARRSTWNRWNLMAEALRVAKPLVATGPAERLAIVDAITDVALTRCISLDPPSLFPASGRYARPDGSSVFDRPDECTFTDLVILDAESDLLEAATDLSGPTAHALSADVALGEGSRLAPDQAAAVRQLGLSGRLVDVLVGPAGSGKTTTLAALLHVWERRHGRGSVIGLAPSSTAAANLAGALGITCENTAKWLHESRGAAGQDRRTLIGRLAGERSAPGTDPRRRRTLETALRGLAAEERRWSLRSGQLVIVDEASLAGTLALRELVSQARSASAKVLLVGDHGQLSAVDAGGAFGLIVDRTGGAQLRSLWRFVEPWEAAATTSLRAGHPRVIERYTEAGRVHAGPGESMLEEAYAAWSIDVAAGRTSILLAPDSATVAALNLRAHNDRVQDGLVRDGGVTTRSGTTVGVGDRIVTRLNDRRLRTSDGFVRNGDLWDVTEARADGSLVVVAARTRLARRGVVGVPGSDVRAEMVLPASYVAENTELAYATTTHRAQGITVDTAHVLGHSGMTRESLYVAMTRGRISNHVYLPVDSIDADCDGLPDPHPVGDARAILEAVLQTTGAERSATATIAERQDEAASLRRLEPIRTSLYADASRARWCARLAALGVGDEALNAVALSPDAGRIFAALDRIDAVAVAPARVVRGLLDRLDAAHPAEHLGAAARAWLVRHGGSDDVSPAASSTIGLSPEGLDVLAHVERLIGERVAALSVAARDGASSMLDDLGLEPHDEAERQEWLAAVEARVAHDDRQPARRAAEPVIPTALSR